MSDETLIDRRGRLLGKGAPLFYRDPVHIVRGDGVWLYDADGKRYVDMYNNVPCVGHANPRVVEAITELHLYYVDGVEVPSDEELTGSVG